MNDYELLEEAINHIKDSDFNVKSLLQKIKEGSSSKSKMNSKTKIKLLCLLELLEDFECFDELVEKGF